MSRRLVIPCHELHSAYAEGHSSKTMAQRHRCSPTTIITYLRQCGLPIRQSRFQACVVPEATLRRLYLEERLPLAVLFPVFSTG
jgi:hypothetical protein